MRRTIRVLGAIGCGLVGLGAIVMLFLGSFGRVGSLFSEAVAIIGVVAFFSAFVLWVIAGTIWMALDDVTEVRDAEIAALQAEVARLKAENAALKKKPLRV